MNIAKIHKSRYVRNYFRDKNLALLTTLIVMFWIIIYFFTFYKPVYRSEAKVLIKDNYTISFITQLEKENSMSDVNSSILTQIEILKSYQLMSFLYDYLKKQSPNEVKQYKSKDSFINTAKKIIKVKNKLSTNILVISLAWENAKESQVLLKVILDEYQRINLTINREIKTNRRKYIDEKIKEIENKLLEARNKLKAFKTGTLSISIDEESKGLVVQKIDFVSNLEQVNASINSTNSSLKELQKQLGMSAKEGMNAVALGLDNRNLIDLRAKLDEATQQYAFESTKNASTNPKMVALKNKINTIKSQVQKQIELTLGKSMKNQKINIFDPVRTKLVSDVISTQANLISLEAQKKSLERSLGNINSNQAKIPLKQYTLDNLKQEETNLSLAYDELRKKQIEATIQEAEVASNVVIVDSPNLPDKPSFPTILHIVLMGLCLSIMISMLISILKTFIEDICEGVEEISETTGKPVIGIIPWFNNNIDDENQHEVNDIAYENIVSNILIRSYKSNAKVLSFSSNNIKKYNSKTIYTIALKLKKLGHSVVIIDSDFRFPTLYRDTNVVDKAQIELSDLILKIEKKLRNNEKVQITDIINNLTYDENNIALCANRKVVKDSYEYFACLAFNIIINNLKEKFDWVLIDTPTVTVAPETLMIAKRSDMFILITTMKVTYSNLTRISEALKASDINFMGCIVRDKDIDVSNYIEFLK